MKYVKFQGVIEIAGDEVRTRDPNSHPLERQHIILASGTRVCHICARSAVKTKENGGNGADRKAI